MSAVEMVFGYDEELERAAAVENWVRAWAASQRNDAAELQRLLHPPIAAGAGMAVSNYAVAEDDGEAYYERHLGAQVANVDAAMDDLSAGPHWAYWVICRRHKLGNCGAWRYERLAPRGVVPADVYRNALMELEPLLAARGLII